MSREADSWDDGIGAEVYADVIRAGRLYPQLARGLIDLLDPGPDQRLLDLATGSGIVAELALPLLGPSGCAVGIDRALAMSEVARREVPSTRASFLFGSVERLPFRSSTFDLGACSAALWHLPRVGSCFEELARVLAPGGRFAFNVPAAQLVDVPDAGPAPLQLALARVGETIFGRPPDPAGPHLETANLEASAVAAGLEPAAQRLVDVIVTQRELVDLLAVPAIGMRLYPEAAGDQAERWRADAADRVDLDEEVSVRWWECLLVRTAAC